MRTWPHRGFSVDKSVFLPAGDRAGIERLVGTMPRCPFSLSRLVQVTETGQVVYKVEKNACRAFPDPQDAGLASGPTRNFQILDPLHERKDSRPFPFLSFPGSGSGPAARAVCETAGAGL